MSDIGAKMCAGFIRNYIYNFYIFYLFYIKKRTTAARNRTGRTKWTENKHCREQMTAIDSKNNKNIFQLIKREADQFLVNWRANNQI